MKKGQTILLYLVGFLLVPAGLLIQMYVLAPFTARFSWQWLALFGAVWMFLELALWLQHKYFLGPIWSSLDFRKRAGWVVAAGVLTLGLYTSAAPNMVRVAEKFPFLAPEETIVLYPVLNSPDATVDFWKVKIGENRVPNSQLLLRGAWQEEKYRLWTNDPSASLTVKGRVPRYFSISFWRSPSGGEVQVKWDGKSKILNLQGMEKKEAIFQFPFNQERRVEPVLSRWIRILTLPGWTFLAFLACGIFYFKLENNPPADSA